MEYEAGAAVLAGLIGGAIDYGGATLHGNGGDAHPDEDEPLLMLGTMMIFRGGMMAYAMGAMVHAGMSIVFALIHVAVYNALGLETELVA